MNSTINNVLEKTKKHNKLLIVLGAVIIFNYVVMLLSVSSSIFSMAIIDTPMLTLLFSQGFVCYANAVFAIMGCSVSSALILSDYREIRMTIEDYTEDVETNIILSSLMHNKITTFWICTGAYVGYICLTTIISLIIL